MITPDEFEPLYQYVPAPIMPGVRNLFSGPMERYRLTVNLDDDEYNFVPPRGSYKYGKRLRPPVMVAGGIGIEPFTLQISTGFTFNLILIIFLILIVYYATNK